jgi:hypothetical protein
MPAAERKTAIRSGLRKARSPGPIFADVTLLIVHVSLMARKRAGWSVHRVSQRNFSAGAALMRNFNVERSGRAKPKISTSSCSIAGWLDRASRTAVPYAVTLLFVSSGGIWLGSSSSAQSSSASG